MLPMRLPAPIPGSALLLALAVPLAAGATPAAMPAATPRSEAFPSTLRVAPARAVLLRGATVLTGTGERIDGGDVLLADGRIAAVGRGLDAGDAEVLDVAGRWVTPGLIDVHSHLGVYPSPSLDAHSDGNEMIDPVTAGVWAEHAVWPQDPGFETALAGGVTTMMVLPGSGNLIGGRGVTLKNVPAATMQQMKFPGAPHGLKMACGENPKRVYGSKGRAPMTRMGNVAGYRQAFADADDYRRQFEGWRRNQAEWEQKPVADRGEAPKVPKRDLKLETLSAVLDGEVLVHIHCYRADEMALMIDLADEFGFRIAAFHHGVEAYKIAALLGERGICGALWADWWGFKLEAYDGIQENLALVDAAAGGCAVTHSDSSEGIQRLNQETAKAMARGQRAGLSIPPERAIRWLTGNAARALGIEAQTGSLEVGKMADLVLWDRDPFSVYAKAERVWIDGVLHFDRAAPPARPRSDFLLGQPTAGAGR
jgi:imidazolonepropionase-like amidohydrolase